MADWEPFVTDPAERARLVTIIQEIAAAVAGAPPDTVDELTDDALFRSAIDDLVPDDGVAGHASLARAVDALNASSDALFGGAARVGFTVAHLTDGEHADRLCAAIDARLVERIRDPRVLDYDLIGGLVGFGVYALERDSETSHGLALAVLDRLERDARPFGPGVHWSTAPELMSPWHRELAPTGYWNYGLAHGSPGAIALLARFVVAGIEPARATALLDRAVAGLLSFALPSRGGRFPSWVPLDGDAPSEPRTRLAWCYGDLGVSIALLSAAIACDDPRWRAEALALAHGCAARTFADAMIHDAALCHGASGIAHVFHRMSHATGDATLHAATRTWLDHALRLRDPAWLAGFPQWGKLADDTLGFSNCATLLTGARGVGLALHAMIAEVSPTWDRLMLSDL